MNDPGKSCVYLFETNEWQRNTWYMFTVGPSQKKASLQDVWLLLRGSTSDLSQHTCPLTILEPRRIEGKET